ncbi:MAG: hypothetical protein HYT93_03160 [Parcubacteria group bacterium]|nr:hypothetical protein [Parcubacteria group bacterium]
MPIGTKKYFFALLLGALFIFFPLFVSAHVGLGMYAGTHAVALVVEPHHSPFVGEDVFFTFYMKDLHGYFPTEPFITSVIIQEITKDNEELNIVALVPETVKSGVYKTSYRFKQAGLYRIEFGFGKADEPDVIRDAVFEIEVRDPGYPISAKMAPTIVLLGVIIFVLGILTEKYIRDRNAFE